MSTNNKLLKIVTVMSTRTINSVIYNRLRCSFSSFTQLYPIEAVLQTHADYHYFTRLGGRSHNRQLCSTTSSRKLPVLTLYTKQPCPLCDEALHHLEPFLDQVVLEKVDITSPENRAWWKLYRYEIPVFHLNGRFLMKHKADLDIFKTALSDFHKKNITS
ncbi:unnamed protein product [Candidula unifasciata]|uniref:Glutaredoxin-like protein n=1 Tax=Candidula unifasciata TaxID=100452 RepID=A0A8S4A7Z5_9EUPU|nr:unnamed protein product [Candidula unifasciata]